MISISTKTGDTGESGLANGKRLSKADVIFEVLGTIDELNSWIGFSITSFSPEFEQEKKFLLFVQDTLFHIGAEIAGSHKTALSQEKLTVLESHSDSLQQSMEKEWYTKFLLPGGTETAARLDIARTICRRAERRIVELHHYAPLSTHILSFVNRLSDYLYILRCFVNQKEQHTESPFDVDSAYKEFVKSI